MSPCFQNPARHRGKSALGRLCCKSRKSQGDELFAETRNVKHSPIRMTSIALPKSPVSLTCGDEIPHIFTRQPRLQPAEFLIPSAKRLLQQYRHLADNPAASAFVGYWTNNGQRFTLVRDGSVADDAIRSLAWPR